MVKWGLPVVVEEPAMSAQHAELQREAAPVIGAAALRDLGEVSRAEAPVPGELVLARIGW
jgi:hypothetical protein